MKKFNELTVTTPKGTELIYFIENGKLNVKTPGGIATVKRVFAPHKNDKVVIDIEENGSAKTTSASYEEAQLIKALFNTVAKENRELYVFDNIAEMDAAEDWNDFGTSFRIEGFSDEAVFAYKYSK